MAAIIQVISSDPKAGDVMVGTRWRAEASVCRQRHGQTRGVRTVALLWGDDVPVFMLAVIKKGDRDNLSKARSATH